MTEISRGSMRRFVALACGSGCARAVASNAYTTSFGTVLGSGHGFVAGTGFSLASNVIAALVALAVVAFALRAGRRDAGRRETGRRDEGDRDAMRRRPALPLPVAGAACALLALGYVAGTAGWFAALPRSAGLALCAGAYAAGMVALTASWFELFVCEPDVPGAVRTLVGGYLVQAGAYAAIGALSGWALCAVAVAALAATFALMAGLRRGLVGIAARCGDRDGGGGEVDAPAPTASPAAPARSLRALLGDLSGSLLCVFVLTAVVGFLHTSVLGSAFEQVIGSVSMSAALLAAAVLLAGIVFVSHRVPQTTAVYRVVFPVMLTVLSLLPFAAEALGRVAGTAMVVCNDLVGMAFVLLLLEVARGCTVPPVALIGVYQAGTHIALVLGLALGLALGAVHAGEDASYATLLILACIYPLAMVLTYLSRRRSRDAESKLIEDVGGSAPRDRRSPESENPGQRGHATQESQAPMLSEERAAQRVVRERVAERVTAYALEKGLTPREAQVAVQLARGRTAGAIASDLGISENTAWAHIKHAYAKLGVHGKQELIELIEREVISRGEEGAH